MNKHKRSLKVNLEDLKAAFDSGFDEIWHYLDLETGEVVLVTGDTRQQLEALLEATDAETIEAVHEDIQNEDLPDWQKDALNSAALVESGYGSRFVEIPKADSWEACEDMPSRAKEPFAASRMCWQRSRRNANQRSRFRMLASIRVCLIG